MLTHVHNFNNSSNFIGIFGPKNDGMMEESYLSTASIYLRKTKGHRNFIVTLRDDFYEPFLLGFIHSSFAAYDKKVCYHGKGHP